MNWKPLNSDTYELGESPFWHPQERMLYWVDIPGKKILRVQKDGSAIDAWSMPSEPGCIAPAVGGGLVIALRNGIFLARAWHGELQHLATLPYDCATVRANDGKCDALGRFWVGTIDEPKANRAAALFSIDCRNGRTPLVQQHAGDALTGNGLAWSPDGETLYWADTPSHTVHAWSFDVQANTLTAQRAFQTFDAKPAGWTFDQMNASGQAAYRGRPDGAAVDVDGNYYCAMFEGQRICKLSPSGVLLAEFPTPAQCPTMPCFGGDDLQSLYITTARHGRSAAELDKFPLSGAVFAMRVEVPGLPVNYFAG